MKRVFYVHHMICICSICCVYIRYVVNFVVYVCESWTRFKVSRDFIGLAYILYYTSECDRALSKAAQSDEIIRYSELRHQLTFDPTYLT